MAGVKDSSREKSSGEKVLNGWFFTIWEYAHLGWSLRIRPENSACSSFYAMSEKISAELTHFLLLSLCM